MEKFVLYSPTQMDLGFGEEEQDKKYTKKIEIPQYEPNCKYVPIYSLYDNQKSNKLIERINKSNISDEEKEFLRIASYRHIVFNYALIADYYANASKEMQELMEDSALVIIDIDNAIANGYVKLNSNIKRIMEESGKAASEIYHNQTTPKSK